MKRRFFLLFAMGLLCLGARAIPADPTPVKVTQPDGTTLTITLHGDEFFHITTTIDGYTVVKNAAGYYTYAQLDGNQLVPGDRIARDVSQRSAGDRVALAALPKGLASYSMVQSGRQMINRRNAAMHRVGAEGMMDYDNFRGLIILINYTNKSFSMPNAGDFYDDMVNTHNFTGYTLNNRHVRMTGSVRDYFFDNSNNIFDPHFDVVGPVDVPYPCTAPGGTSNAEDIFYAALDSVDSEVNFQDYDIDGDGYVDMVFFLVAGFSANYSGNNGNYLWPHMYYLYNAPAHDGVLFWLYACSTEIAGWEGYYSDVNGIGTFCHEFGHVLGLPDLYDTDYEESGGESRNPGAWSVMAGGSGSNFGRNPVGYSLYERYALGFADPVLLNESGRYELEPLDLSNEGFRLNTPTPDEFFLIENRQPGKWDRFLPGHGMMVARVDSTDSYIWWYNKVNCNPDRMYYELLCANYTGEDSPNDPFPGQSGVTTLTNFTTPSLMTWDKLFNDYGIIGITETDEGLISFELENDTSIITAIEDFEDMPVASADENPRDVPGVYSHWNFTKCAVAEPGEGKCNGLHAVAMKKPSMIATTAPLNIIPFAVRYTVFNSTSTSASFKLYFSVDSGATWEEPYDTQLTVLPKSTKSVQISLPTDVPIMLRINQTGGNTKSNCYLDDIVLYYKDTWGPVAIPGDVNGDGEVNIADVNMVIYIILGGDVDADVNRRADVNGDGEVNIADVNTLINIILG